MHLYVCQLDMSVDLDALIAFLDDHGESDFMWGEWEDHLIVSTDLLIKLNAHMPGSIESIRQHELIAA